MEIQTPSIQYITQQSNENFASKFHDDIYNALKQVLPSRGRKKGKPTPISGFISAWLFGRPVEDEKASYSVGQYFYYRSIPGYSESDTATFFQELKDHPSLIQNEHSRTLRTEPFSILNPQTFWNLLKEEPEKMLDQFTRMILGKFFPGKTKEGDYERIDRHFVVSHLTILKGSKLNKNKKLIAGFSYRLRLRPSRKPRQTKYILDKISLDGSHSSSPKAIKSKHLLRTIKRYRVRKDLRA
jgi:hypothetical protein